MNINECLENILLETHLHNYLRRTINKMKIEATCKECGEDDYRCLHYHHVNGKSDNISSMITKMTGYTEWDYVESLKKILEEIKDCIVLCSNCHRKVHQIYNPKFYRDLRQKEFDYDWHTYHSYENDSKKPKHKIKTHEAVTYVRVKNGCKECGEHDYRCLDFHHTNPGNKVAAVATLASGSTYAATMNEVKKCIVLCSNCHQKHGSVKNSELYKIAKQLELKFE